VEERDSSGIQWDWQPDRWKSGTMLTASASPTAAADSFRNGWPDLPDAQSAQVGPLARAWLKFGDWSAVGPLCDALADAGRDADVRTVRECVAIAASSELGYGRQAAGSPTYYYITSMEDWRRRAMVALWFDLFDFNATAARLGDLRPD
jgi:hypothetical protein